MITVIIPIYNRTRFLPRALESLESQTIRYNLFEVIIVTNSDIEISKEYEFKLRIIRVTDKELSLKLIKGISLAEGTIISFLEDDDIFLPGKLFAVNEAFSDTESVFYYNRHIRTHSTDLVNVDTFVNQTHQRKLLRFDSNNLSDGTIRHHLRGGYGFNLSSMSIRKKVLSEYLNVLSKLDVQYIDTYLYFISILSKGTIVVDKIPRTIVRMHSENSSGFTDASVILSGGKEHVYNSGLMIFEELSKNKETKHSNVINEWIKLAKIDELMKYGTISKLNCIRKMLEYLRYKKGPVVRTDVIIKFLAYIINKKLMTFLIRLYHY